MIINKLKKIARIFSGERNNFVEQYRNLLVSEPLDSKLHFQFGKEALNQGNYPLAIAELKTAIALGRSVCTVQKYLERAQKKSSSLFSLDHNTYYRFNSLRLEIEKIVGCMENYSILDIGGGEGYLA